MNTVSVYKLTLVSFFNTNTGKLESGFVRALYVNNKAYVSPNVWALISKIK